MRDLVVVDIVFWKFGGLVAVCRKGKAGLILGISVVHIGVIVGIV